MMAAPRADAASRNAAATMTQPAFEPASCFTYCGFERKDSDDDVAVSSGSIDATRIAPSPISSPPSRSVISRSVTSLTDTTRLLAALGVERLDHLVGDVDLRAPEDGLLENQVVLLGLEDLLDDAVRALDNGRELLVLALAQVFLELAALPLQLAVLVDELALAPRALRFGEGRRVLVELVAGALEAGGEVVQVLLALGEFGFELGLSRLRRHGVAQDPVAV